MKYIFALCLVTLLSCNNSKKESYKITSSETKTDQEHPGKKLMETFCYACHSPSASHDARLAPPMIAIKKMYINSNTSKEDFINSMQEWIKNPTKEKAKMLGAVSRFGVMPKTPYPEESIKEIADYMFDNDITQPEWFEAHFKEQKNIKNKTETYADRGLRYALGTKKVLGQNLIGTIQRAGTQEALTFCNEKAYPLTDSMAVVYNASIKRVSDKPRNPKNQANKSELEYINTYKERIKNNEISNPIVEELKDKVHVYYPITTNIMCLQCHGKPDEQISSETFTLLKKLYPKDKAIGYDINEVRGVWHVTFQK